MSHPVMVSHPDDSLELSLGVGGRDLGSKEGESKEFHEKKFDF